jgi:hypothetical protein
VPSQAGIWELGEAIISEGIEIFVWILKIIVSHLNPFWALSNDSEHLANVQKRTVADQERVEKVERADIPFN